MLFQLLLCPSGMYILWFKSLFIFGTILSTLSQLHFRWGQYSHQKKKERKKKKCQRTVNQIKTFSFMMTLFSFYISIYLPNPSNTSRVWQKGKYLNEEDLVWIQFSFSYSLTKMKELCLPYYLRITVWRTSSFMPFQMALALNEMQTTSFMIWT